MQRERMQEGANSVPSLREYAARWGVTPERLGPGQKVMHPGPMNRGVEIGNRVAVSVDALVRSQARSRLDVRQAVCDAQLGQAHARVDFAAAEGVRGLPT